MKRVIHWMLVAALALSSLAVVGGLRAEERVISHDELIDRLSGFWIGQLLGNYIGFPFENKYVEEPIPILVDRVYTADYDGEPELKINTKTGGDIYRSWPVPCRAHSATTTQTSNSSPCTR